MAAVERLQQIGLLGLRRHTRRRPGALHVDDHERELGHDGQADGLRLQRDAGARRGGDAERTAEARSQRGGDAGDLVFRLERHHADVLAAGEFVQDVGGRGDGVGAQEELHAGLVGTRHEAVGRGEVAGDLPVAALRHRGRIDDGLHRERFGGLAVRVAGPERGEVGVANVRLLRELRREELLRAFGGARVHPAQQAERKHVLRPRRVLAREAEAFDGALRQRREVQLVHRVVGEGAVLEGVCVPPDLLEVTRGEVVGVHDDDRAGGQILQVHLERSRVHRHEHVRHVAGGDDVEVGEVELEARHPGQRALRRANLGGEIGKCGDVVAEASRLCGEAVTGQLHAVAGIAGEADDDSVELLGHESSKLVVGRPRQCSSAGEGMHGQPMHQDRSSSWLVYPPPT